MEPCFVERASAMRLTPSWAGLIHKLSVRGTLHAPAISQKFGHPEFICLPHPNGSKIIPITISLSVKWSNVFLSLHCRRACKVLEAHLMITVFTFFQVRTIFFWRVWGLTLRPFLLLLSLPDRRLRLCGDDDDSVGEAAAHVVGVGGGQAGEGVHVTRRLGRESIQFWKVIRTRWKWTVG